jgi:hypothetical protein
MTTHVKFVGVPIRDQGRALKFYTEQLGFEVATAQPCNEKQRWISVLHTRQHVSSCSRPTGTRTA